MQYEPRVQRTTKLHLIIPKQQFWQYLGKNVYVIYFFAILTNLPILIATELFIYVSTISSAITQEIQGGATVEG